MAYYFSEDVIARQFFESLDECGIKPRGSIDLDMDGLIHRFAVDGDRYSDENGSGAYFIHADDYPNWGVMDFHHHSEMQLFKLDLSTLTPNELAEYRAQLPKRETSRSPQSFEEAERWRVFMEAKRQEKLAQWEAENRKKQAQKEAETNRREAFKRDCAHREYNNLIFGDSADRHPYIMEKITIDPPNVTSPYYTLLSFPYYRLWTYDSYTHGKYYKDPREGEYCTLGIVQYPLQGSLCKKGDLLIPLIDTLTDEFSTVQYISWDKGDDGRYQKRFYSSYTNACYRFAVYNCPFFGCDFDARKSDTLYLCEGFFTGLGVSELFKYYSPVYCAMSCSNLRNVAESLRKRFPKKRIILMADNDRHTELTSKDHKNPGIKAAIELKKTGLIDAFRIPPLIRGQENANIDWYDIFIELKKAQYLKSYESKIIWRKINEH